MVRICVYFAGVGRETTGTTKIHSKFTIISHDYDNITITQCPSFLLLCLTHIDVCVPGAY